jgi:hypothetical protein
MTLIVAANSDGVYGRCDAKCHNATGPRCDCICRGAFHGLGAGSPELLEAVQKCGEKMLEELAGQGHKVEGLREVLARGFPARQMAMF